eukprot:GFKZ01014480.1.p1 GENE.GFKZ01014480.1~~GFKZ01014480.1.p1  ORF type:complete len:382 (-),score=30.44 GFKZ01014480.1:114-1259(-)
MRSSPVTVGYASDRWDSSRGTWYDTHIGGIPIFPPGLLLDVPPCAICSQPRLCVFQAFAPHRNHLERVIYLFGCNKITCSSQQSSWWAIRAFKVNKDSLGGQLDVLDGRANGKPDSSPASINWDTDSDSSSSDDSDLADELQLLSLQAQLAESQYRLGSNGSRRTKENKAVPAAPSVMPTCETYEQSPEPVHPESAVNANAIDSVFQAYYVEVADEPQSPHLVVQDSHVDSLLRKYEEEEKTLSGDKQSETWAAEQDEEVSKEELHFESFQERIRRAPGHILRYAFDGEPIWPTIPSPQPSPRTCQGCGSQLVFELQVLGSCLHYLQPEKAVAGHQEEAGMAFASVAIFTCSADCSKDQLVAEAPSFKVVSQAVCVQKDDW